MSSVGGWPLPTHPKIIAALTREEDITQVARSNNTLLSCQAILSPPPALPAFPAGQFCAPTHGNLTRLTTSRIIDQLDEDLIKRSTPKITKNCNAETIRFLLWLGRGIFRGVFSSPLEKFTRITANRWAFVWMDKRAAGPKTVIDSWKENRESWAHQPRSVPS